jgi:putative ABC transport system permease protein
MDLPAAQALLGKGDKVDRLDLHLLRDVPLDAAKRDIMRALDGSARVSERSAYGRSARDLLFSMRIVLALASMIAIVVAFFIIYHTVLVSVGQRRHEIILLRTLGVPALTIVAALLGEALVIGAISALAGFGLGFALAKAALASFGTLAAAWIRLPRADLAIEIPHVLLAAGVGLGVSLGATALAMRSMLSEELASSLSQAVVRTAKRQRFLLPLIGSIAALVFASLLIGFAPRKLPFTALIVHVLSTSGVVLIAIGLLAPFVCWFLARALTRLFRSIGPLSLRLAASNVAKRPTEPIAVVVAIVMALGATLADASLIASVKATWFRWMSDYVKCDVVVTGEGGIDDLLTLTPISEDVVDEMRTVPGVREIRSIRVVEGEYAGHPVVIEGIDDAPATYPLPRFDWAQIEGAFRNGEGVIVSENLGWRAALEPGSNVELSTPAGMRSFRVLAFFPDALAGDLGSIAFDRQAFRRLWDDHMVSRIHVWADAPERAAELRSELQARFGPSRAMRAVTVAEARAAVGALVDNAFASAYALLAVSITISVVGIVNFLLAGVLDRQPWFRTLYTVGMSKRQIGAALVGEGALIGLVGVILGLIAGGIASYIIVRESIPMVNGWHFDYVFPTNHAAILSMLALLLTSIAGLLPAWLALRRNGYLDA